MNTAAYEQRTELIDENCFCKTYNHYIRAAGTDKWKLIETTINYDNGDIEDIKL